MAVQIGTATDYIDLLDQLRLFLTTNADLVAAGQQWQQLRWQERPDAAGEYELIVKGPGLAGTDEIFAGIRTYSDVGADYYNWELGPMLGYDADFAWASQPGLAPATRPQVCLWNSAISYWMVANGRRFVVVPKVSTVYELAHMGLILPYGPPSALPHPYFCAGSHSQANERWSDTSSYHSHGVTRPKSTTPTNSLLYTGEQWRYFGSSISATYRGGLYPYFDGPATVFSSLRANIDGGRTLLPIQPCFQSPDAMYGELDGCYWVSGHGNAAENIVTVDGVDHLVVPNVHRAGVLDYWALRLE